MVDKKKIRIGEELEKVEAMGQESEKKGIKATQEVMKEKEKVEKKKEEKILTLLDETRRKNLEYRKYLLWYLHEMVSDIEWPKAYQWGVWFDGKGVILSIRDKFGKIKKRAFKVTYIPKYDANICYRFAVWAEDVLDASEGRLAQMQKSGIWTPPNHLKNN